MSLGKSSGKTEPISYILLVRCDKAQILNIKSLNYPKIKEGIYIYVGSANLRNPIRRVLRHFRRTKRLRWHIDYLTSSCTALASIIINGLTEADTYGVLEELTQGRDSSEELRIRPSIKKFGASDNINHKTHLFKVEKCKDPYTIISELLKVLVGMNSVNRTDLILENS